MSVKLIHSGSTILNLALSGKVEGGWPLGRMSNVIGDRSSGKTLLALEAAMMFMASPPEEIKPKVIYFESESAFDSEYAQSLGLAVDDITVITGETIEDMFEAIEKRCSETKEGEGTLFIVDSLDALSSREEVGAAIDKGSYSMQKQKKLGQLFRRLIRKIGEANLHLFIISQIRENISTMPFAPKWRRAGGKSLDFYASHIVWLQEKKKINHKKTELDYGIECIVKITKNKIASPNRQVWLPILFGVGVDNTWSMIDYLTINRPGIEEGILIKSSTGWYSLENDGTKHRLNDLITEVENDKNLYHNLITRCEKSWRYVEKETKPIRKSKVELLKIDE